MDPLQAHSVALDAIDALTQTPEIRELLKPLAEAYIKQKHSCPKWHYQCPGCDLHFWTIEPLDNIDCPNAKCGCKWLPHTMDGAYERGHKEQF